MPPQDNRPVVFGKKAVDRIRRTVVRVENSPYFSLSKKTPPNTWTFGVVEAIVTTAITAASGTTYGTGYAQIYTAGATDLVFTSPVAVSNWYQNSGTIAVGAHILICWRNNGWLIVGADC